jgi:hypothetical protein
MKKALLFLSLMFILVQGYSSGNDFFPTLAIQGSFTVGAAATNISFTNNYNLGTGSYKPGYNFGGMIRLDYIYEYFDFELGISYTRCGGIAKNDSYFYAPLEENASYTLDYTLKYLDFPVMVNLTPTPWLQKRVYLGGGLILSLGNKGTIKETVESPQFTSPYKNAVKVVWYDNEESPADSHLDGIDLLYAGHVGYRFSRKFELRVGYRSSIFNIDYQNATMKNNMYMISYIWNSTPAFERRKAVSEKKLRRHHARR